LAKVPDQKNGLLYNRDKTLYTTDFMGMVICDEYGLEGAEWMDLGQHVSEELLTQPFVTERRQKLSFPFGDAEMVQIVLPGTLIIYGDLALRQQQIRMRAVDQPDMIELHFSLAGGGSVLNKASGRTYVFTPHQQNIIYMPEFDGVADFYQNRQRGFKFFEVHFTTLHFLQLAHDSCEVLNRFADQVAARMPIELSPDGLPTSMAMQACINDIMNCRLHDGLKLLFLQAKCVELLTLQAQAFEQAQQMVPRQVLKSDYEKDCIMQARDYLIQHMDAPPSLPELSRIAGLNTYKLKNGFKEMFNTTVYGYLNNVKLNLAREHLLEGSSIKEVALQLGYGSVQHFNKAYSKKFGIPPGKSRK
jgi:AraC family transcriptional activator of pyochelin receptor